MRHFFWSDIFTWLSFIDEKENVADDILTLWQTGKCCLTVPIKSKNCICLVCSLEVPWPFTNVHLQFHHQPQAYIDSRQLLCQSVLSYKFWVSVCNLEAKLEDHPQDESGSAQFRCKVLRPLLEDFQCKKPECEATDRQLKGATPAKSPANLSSFASFFVFVLFHHFEKHTCRYTYRMKLPESKDKTAATLEVLQRCTNRQFWNRSQPILSGAYFLFLFFSLAQSDQGEAKITSVIHISDLSSYVYVAGTSTSINGGKPELYTVTNPQSLKSI